MFIPTLKNARRHAQAKSFFLFFVLFVENRGLHRSKLNCVKDNFRLVSYIHISELNQWIALDVLKTVCHVFIYDLINFDEFHLWRTHEKNNSVSIPLDSRNKQAMTFILHKCRHTYTHIHCNILFFDSRFVS